MARLQKGKKEANKKLIRNILWYYVLGLRESELASELGWDRRRLNNYLHELQIENRIYKDGRIWHV